MFITAITIILKIFLFIYAFCSLTALFGVTLYMKDFLNAANEFYSKCTWERRPVSLIFTIYSSCIIPIININIAGSIIVFALKTQEKQKEALATAIEILVSESKKRAKK